MSTTTHSRPRARRVAVKTTLNLAPETADTLKAMAAARNTTFAEVIRRALQVEQFIQDAQKEGRRILVDDGENQVKELVIF